MERLGGTFEHPKGVDRDHLLFYRTYWEACGDGRTLRRNRWLIPPLDREIHEAKHGEVAFVPMLGRFVLQRVVRDFKPEQGDYVGSLDGLINTIETAQRDNRLPHDERQYAAFTIDALARTRPFVVEGLVQ